MVYLARRSRLGSAALCCGRWLCCAAVYVRFLLSALHKYLQTGSGSRQDNAHAALLLAVGAACTLEGKLCDETLPCRQNCILLPAPLLMIVRAPVCIRQFLWAPTCALASVRRCAAATAPARAAAASTATRGA